MTTWNDFSERILFEDNFEPYKNMYICLSCFKVFKNKNRCEKHYMSKCNMPGYQIDNYITTRGNVHIVKINDLKNIKNANRFFRKASYNLSYISKKELGKDFNFVGKNHEYNERIYLILEDKEIKGYILFKKLNENYILENIYIVPFNRRKHYATFLLEESLKDLGETIASIIYRVPLSEKFEKLLSSKGLIEVKTLS